MSAVPRSESETLRGGPAARPRAASAPGRLLWRRLTANTGAVIGFVLLAAILLIALLAPLLTPYSPYAIAVQQQFRPPSSQHLMGTDDLGRDVGSRVIAGTRISLMVASLVLLLAGGTGVILGIVSGYRGGVVDEAIMRASDIFLAFPSFLLTMAIVAALGPGLANAVLAIGLAWWPRYARLMRGQVLRLRQVLYAESARALGAGDARILVRHILPNCLAPLIVQLTMDAGGAILITASLSFVGLGARPPMPEWGFMTALGRQFLLTAWWVPIFPGLAISLTVAAFMFMGDALRDLMDPALRNVGGGWSAA